MTEEKNKIIIPDTNFIIEYNKNFVEVLKMLSKIGDIYLSQITIEERLAQVRIKLKKDYSEIEELSQKHKDLIQISYKQNLEEKLKAQEEFMLNNYKSVIGNNIIKFPPDEKTFSIVLERVYNKIAPFSNVEGASDKGFKDTLLWLSLLEFFKTHGENKEIILITDDKSFIKKNIDPLKKEFLEKTKKEIQIHGNEFYKTLLNESIATKSEKMIIQKELTALELDELKKEIRKTVLDICLVYMYDGDEDDFNADELYQTQAFSTQELLTPAMLEKNLENLERILNDNIFEEYLPAYTVFDVVDKVYHSVNIKQYEALLKLYNKIKTSYNDYLPQFFQVICNMINRYYKEPLPF